MIDQPAVRLFVGGHASRVQGEPQDLAGDRMFTAAHPPVDCQYPYQILAVLSYCDRRLHRGTIYRAAGFQLARTNERGIETWYTTDVAPLSPEQDADIRRQSEVSLRSQRIRGQRAQMELGI